MNKLFLSKFCSRNKLVSIKSVGSIEIYKLFPDFLCWVVNLLFTNIHHSSCFHTRVLLFTDLFINFKCDDRVHVVYYYVEAALKLMRSANQWPCAEETLQDKYNAHHHLLEEVNDLLFREVHGAVIGKSLWNWKLGLDGEGICWVVYKGLLLLHPGFPEAGEAITLKANTEWLIWILWVC